MRVEVQLGIDVGGTASRWVACSGAGEIVARGKASGATGHVFNPVERERLHDALTVMAEELTEKKLTVGSVAAGLTGYGPAAADAITTLMAETLGVAPHRILVIDDITLAYRSVFANGEGHLVSAGTGSIGLHIGEDDAQIRVGGRGILIDDAGSGGWIALRAVSHIYRCLDHTGNFDDAPALAREVFAIAGGEDWSAVRQYVYGGDRGRIGKLALAVARAAEDGDKVAASILREAGNELALLAQALVARAGERPIAFIGGVLDLHSILVEAIRRTLQGHDIRFVKSDAALAAARLGGTLLAA